MTKRLRLLLASILPGLLVLGITSPVFAEIQIEVSDNGADSANSVSSSQTATTDVSQQNQATVANDVTQEANTGGNSTSGNNADASVTTGDIQSSTTVENNLNSS